MKKEYFKGQSPCIDCPYRTTAPLKKWDVCEFKSLWDNQSDPFSKLYLCHKNNGTACKGWLITQVKEGVPNINLRLALIKGPTPYNYINNLRARGPLYPNVKEMIRANYPELLPE